MCGIAGVISKINIDRNKEVAQMCQRMVLRGPDHKSCEGYKNKK